MIKKTNAPMQRGARPTGHKTTARARTYSGHTKTAKASPAYGANKLKIIVVGGNEEVGRNMTLLEYGNDIIIVDMGLQFPEEDMPGVDYIIPNIDYLKGKEKNVKGVIITHAHYDHIGGIPHLMKRLGNPPLFSSDLSIKIIEKRQLDFKDAPKLNSQIVTTDDKIKLGVFEIGFFGVSHNIPTSMGLVIKTPLGVVVHTGDFKLDMDAGGDTPAEIGKIAKLADQKVLALLSDSTNAPQVGHQISELEIQKNMDDIIRNATGRLIIGTFASLLGRIQQIIWAAEKFNKKIVIEGFSMKSNVEIAMQLGYIKVNKGTLITAKQIKDYSNDKILILCTGAQGEGRAVLMRIANAEHRSIKIEKGDTVVFSSSVIPGNERSVQRLKDSIYRLGADVIHYQMMDIHAGGHARKEDLKLLLNLVRPQYFIPIEGNHSFLRLHGKIAEETGIDPKKIFVADNGQVMEFTKTGGKLTNQKIPTDYVFVDGLGVGDVSNVVLRDRQVMANDGMLVVIATVDAKTGKLIQSPDIISRGFIYMKENKKLVEQTRSKIKSLFKDNKPKQAANDMYIKSKIRNEIGQFLFTKTQRRPMILPVIIEV
jgi:ribonuclease J